MSRLVVIILCCYAFNLHAQEAAKNPGAAVNAFFKALSSEKDSARISLIKNICTKDVRFSAALTSSSGQVNIVLGNSDEFFSKSKDFFTRFSAEYAELDRVADYYVDIASINSIVRQMLKNKTTGKVYEQLLWYQFDLIYFANSWHITFVGWTNESESKDVFESQISDTLWHEVSK